MQRLFLALPLPDETKAALRTLQPVAQRGVRLVVSDQMHLTLHFIGPAEIDRLVEELGRGRCEPFLLTIRGIGHFETARNTITLWAGVDLSPPLLDLHRALGERLTSLNLPLDSRPFSPHITLARGDRSLMTDLLETFAADHSQFQLPAVPVTEFQLYSSTLLTTGPVYMIERRFDLTMAVKGS
ncbi:MAG: RNA 2',3'-cyclic phosphodiesterase [Planctomycetota bacterium]